jgi:hypothetical protein
MRRYPVFTGAQVCDPQQHLSLGFRAILYSPSSILAFSPPAPTERRTGCHFWWGERTREPGLRCLPRSKKTSPPQCELMRATYDFAPLWELEIWCFSGAWGACALGAFIPRHTSPAPPRKLSGWTTDNASAPRCCFRGCQIRFNCQRTAVRARVRAQDRIAHIGVQQLRKYHN